MKIKRILLLVTTFLVINSTVANELVISFSPGNSEPYAFLESKEGNVVLSSGIIKDLGDDLGKEMGVPTVYKKYPRKRLEYGLEKGHLHGVCIWNPHWASNPENYDWSIPLFEESNWFALKKENSFPIKSFDDLHGKRLGTILGYYYVGLMDHFKQKLIIRYDVHTLKQNFNKLNGNRIDALIDSNILIEYYLLSNNIYDQYSIGEKVASKHDIYCGFSKKSPFPISQINAAFTRMKDRGDIENILKKYRRFGAADQSANSP